MKIIRYLLILSLGIFMINCSNGQDKNGVSDNNTLSVNNNTKAIENIISSPQFSDYWYSGKAELNRYELSQSRYGEIHEGEAVLIFVTEDFLKDKQVKFEGKDKNNEVISILKLNLTKKFFTGIYPYSMMTSVFTPVNLKDKTLKVSTTSQEWCGHTFSQINLRGKDYKSQLYSYFMNEGDTTKNLEGVFLEDEIWTILRIDPLSLPTGSIKMIPGTQVLRLMHREIAVENATADLENIQDSILSDKDLNKYSIKYNDFDRTLSIFFEPDFPHAILKWTEEGDTNNEGKLTTIATRTHSLNEPYWSMNSLADSIVAQNLGVKKINY